MAVSENVVYPIVPNGFADHYPVFKWPFHWEYTLFSDKPTCSHNVYKVAELKPTGSVEVLSRWLPLPVLSCHGILSLRLYPVVLLSSIDAMPGTAPIAQFTSSSIILSLFRPVCFSSKLFSVVAALVLSASSSFLS